MTVKWWPLRLLYLATLVYTSENAEIPKFGKQFQRRFELKDLVEVCLLTPRSVETQLNCVDCLKNISSVLLTNNGKTLYIGARTMLLSMDMDSCTISNHLTWTDNIITQVIKLDKSSLLACGSSLGAPEAIILRPDLTALEKIGNLDLPRMCGQSARWGVSYLRSGDAIFAGVNLDSRSSAITKFTVGYYTDKYLSADRAVTTNDLLFRAAEFVASWEIGSFVYFLMREEREEGRFSASIGRICKNDLGNTNDQSHIVNTLFLSFVKTEVTCTMRLSTKTNLNFEVVYAATFNPDTQQLYATFTQYLKVDIGGYAVCSYSLADIDKSFSGQYYSYNSDGDQIAVDPPYPFDCQRQRDVNLMTSLYEASSPVKQLSKYPLYYALKKFTAIVTDSVGEMTLIYLGTDSGTVEKLSLDPSTYNLLLLSEFSVAGPHAPVTKLQFTNTQKRELVAVSPDSLARFSVSQCGRLEELTDCISIRDPHCCWCQTSHSCSHVNDCEECVNDPIEGKLTNVFTRISTYRWVRQGECEPSCEESADTCNTGTRLIQTFSVYPSIKETARSKANCTYTDSWIPKRPEPHSQNVTTSDRGAKEARYSGSSDSRLFKILAIVFGSLFVISICLIVFLMVYSRRQPKDTASCGLKKKIDRTNSHNIIPETPISYMKKGGTVEMGGSVNTASTLIMPEGLDKVASNSPYRSHMTTEDERLLQVNIRDPTENMYSDVYNSNAQTLPRNFGHSVMGGHPGPLQQQLPYTMTLQRPSPASTRPYPYTPADYLRHHQGPLS